MRRGPRLGVDIAPPHGTTAIPEGRGRGRRHPERGRRTVAWLPFAIALLAVLAGCGAAPEHRATLDVRLVGPRENEATRGPVSFSAQPVSGRPRAVTFLVDGVPRWTATKPPYVYAGRPVDSATLGPGWHTLAVRATYPDQRTASASTRIQLVEAATALQTPEPTTTPVPAGRLWGTDFEHGDRGVYKAVRTEGSGVHATREVTTERARTGRRSLKIVVPPATSGGTVGRYQLVANMPDGHEGDDRWYGFSEYLDNDWDLSEIARGRSYFVGFFGFRWQGTTANGPGSDLDGLDSAGGPQFGMAVNLTGTTELPDYRSLGPIVKDRWIDWVVHVKWSTGPDGVQQVWRDGVAVADYHGRTMLYPDAFEHRIGLYEGIAVDQTRTFYIDNHRVGLSYAAVDPSR